MISKKDALTLGILAVGGIAVASAFSKEGGEFESSAPGAIRGGGGFIPKEEVYSPGAPIIYQIAAQPEARFPEPVDYTEFLREFLAPVSPPDRSSRGGTSSSYTREPTVSKKTALSSDSYVYTKGHGYTITTPVSTEEERAAHSASMAAEFGGGTTSKKRSSSGSSSRSSSQRSADKQRSRERRASSPEGGGF